MDVKIIVHWKCHTFEYIQVAIKQPFRCYENPQVMSSVCADLDDFEVRKLSISCII